MGDFSFFETSSISYGTGDDVGHDEARVLAVGKPVGRVDADGAFRSSYFSFVVVWVAVGEECLDEELGGVADVLGLEEFLCGVVFLPAG